MSLTEQVMTQVQAPDAKDEYIVPPLGTIMAFRGVHALSDVNSATGMLRASHYATCLIGGREPMWGVWTVHGVFQRFFGSKAQIAEAYPKKTWRMRSATWNLIDVHSMIAVEKREEMRKLYRKGQTLNSSEPIAALTEGGNMVVWKDRDKIKGNYRPLYAGVEVRE